MSSLTPFQLALVVAILVLPIIPNLWAIWHIFRNDFATPAEKKGWIWLNVFLPVLGGIIYFFVGRRRTLDALPTSPQNDISQSS
ncbi:PLDc N-terminal domain-containing protein [Desulfoplanes formicivorans]|uniref:Membrane protein n=1 Tax=Desulfoplanes formicivorans TaxID=1592317 RepID=A0A194AET7_9BACT|nr:PLD nuclease N-terminal domain-containing protein [Desulfoplanes formicivorans]GAU07843.1 membrane protein [Desulfoplanes formicivorans]